MKKQLVSFEIKKGERIYQFFIQMDSPLGEIHDVLFEMKSHILELMKDNEEKEKIEKKVEIVIPEIV